MKGKDWVILILGCLVFGLMIKGLNLKREAERFQPFGKSWLYDWQEGEVYALQARIDYNAVMDFIQETELGKGNLERYRKMKQESDAGNDIDLWAFILEYWWVILCLLLVIPLFFIDRIIERLT
jgi:hypothetical protein